MAVEIILAEQKSTSQDEWRKEVFKVYDLIRQYKESYEIMIGGVWLTVLPNVFSPKYFTDSLWFAKELRTLVKDSSLLEIGTGTGIIALFCALNGAKVIATDINPDAVKNAQINFEKYHTEAQVRLGDLYEPIMEDEKFDYIFWNHPFNNWHEGVNDVLLRAGFDHNYQSLKMYVSGAGSFLTQHGRLLLGTGGQADLETIRKIAKENDYTLVLIAETFIPLSEGSTIDNSYLIYEFKKENLG